MQIHYIRLAQQKFVQISEQLLQGWKVQTEMNF